MDWETVTLFYSALHMVDLVLARRNIHPDNHGDRRRNIRTFLRPIRQEYVSLEQISRRARYIADIYQQERDQAIRDYHNIKKYVESVLSYTI